MILLAVIDHSPVQGANTENDFTSVTSTGSLLTGGNWSLGHVPTVSEDATYTGSATGIRALTAGSLTVGSFNITSASSFIFSIRNNTNTATDSTLTLGGAGNLGNMVAPNNADLLYVASGATLNIRGDNGGTSGTGTLRLVLGQSGNFDAAGTVGISSVISDGGNGYGITKTGTGTLILAATNTYSGGTTLNNGTIQMSGAVGRTGSGSITSGTLGSTSGTLTVNGGTLDLSGTSQAVGALNGIGGTVSNSSATASTLTVGSGNNSGSYAGSVSNTGAIAVTKVGTGTETLTGNNNYTGQTTINTNGGTLEIKNDSSTTSGRLSGTSSVMVNSGGSLLLSGAGNADRVRNAAGITLNGGTIAKGAGVNEGSTSSFGLGALTLSANSVLDYMLSSGTLSFASFSPGSNILSIINYVGTGSPQGSDQLIFNQNESTRLSDFNFGFGAGVNVAQFDLGNGFWEVYSTQPIPEPGTWMAAALALGAIGYSQRRRLCVIRRACSVDVL